MKHGFTEGSGHWILTSDNQTVSEHMLEERRKWAERVVDGKADPVLFAKEVLKTIGAFQEILPRCQQLLHDKDFRDELEPWEGGSDD